MSTLSKLSIARILVAAICRTIHHPNPNTAGNLWMLDGRLISGVQPSEVWYERATDATELP